ncbi:MAG: hypothetical protein WCU80_07500 [Paludibacteraceae bacterium]
MEIVLTVEENGLLENLVNAGFSDEIAIAHVMQNTDVEIFVNDCEDSEEEDEETEEAA